jgi:hypothetical protein
MMFKELKTCWSALHNDLGSWNKHYELLDIYYSTLKIVTQAYTFLLEFEGGVGYYYPTLEIVGVDNWFIRQ